MSNSLFKLKILVLFSCASLLTACVQKIDVLPTEDPNWPIWQTHKQTLEKIQDFSMQGKVGVQTGSKGGSARLIWQLDSKPFEQYIELYGPFGGGRIIITANQNMAQLKDAKGNLETAKNTETVLHRQLGWRIPFAQLTSWVKGLPASNSDQVLLDQQGLLAQTRNANWTVNYSQYQQIENLTLPRKMEIVSRPGWIQFYDDKDNFLSDQIKIKIILQDWQTTSLNPSH